MPQKKPIYIKIYLLKSMNSKLVFFYLAILVVASAQSSDTCCKNYQIQVSGEGKASAQPDVAILSISFNEKGVNSAGAVKKLSAKVNEALTVLKANGYSGDAYETNSLYVNPEYKYDNGESTIIGYQASQSLTVRVRGLDAKGQKVATLIDALAQVNGININSVTFDIYDKTPLQTQARAAAFKDAKAKAEDYAAFAGASVGKVLTIDDFSYVEAPAARYEAKDAAFGGVAAMSVATTSVPVGEQDVSYSTTITFALR